jgi:hypothetical protein
MYLAILVLLVALIYVVWWPWGLIYVFGSLYICREGFRVHIYWSIVDWHLLKQGSYQHLIITLSIPYTQPINPTEVKRIHSLSHSHIRPSIISINTITNASSHCTVTRTRITDSLPIFTRASTSGEHGREDHTIHLRSFYWVWLQDH